MNATEQTSMNPNCYDCKWRGELDGDCHSCCSHPLVKPSKDDPLNAILSLLAAVGRIDISVEWNPLGVKGGAHGIRKGWFCWPMNFDPVWLESCNGFEPKGGEVRESTNDK